MDPDSGHYYEFSAFPKPQKKKKKRTGVHVLTFLSVFTSRKVSCPSTTLNSEGTASFRAEHRDEGREKRGCQR